MTLRPEIDSTPKDLLEVENLGMNPALVIILDAMLAVISMTSGTIPMGFDVLTWMEKPPGTELLT